MTISKALLTASLFVLLSTSGCSIALQRVSQAETRAHDYAVWILDERKADRREVRDQRKAAVKDMEIGISKLVAEGEMAKALAARDKIIKYIEKHTPSFTDAVKSIKGFFEAVKE